MGFILRCLAHTSGYDFRLFVKTNSYSRGANFPGAYSVTGTQPDFKDGNLRRNFDSSMLGGADFLGADPTDARINDASMDKAVCRLVSALHINQTNRCQA